MEDSKKRNYTYTVTLDNGDTITYDTLPEEDVSVSKKDECFMSAPDAKDLNDETNKRYEDLKKDLNLKDELLSNVDDLIEENVKLNKLVKEQEEFLLHIQADLDDAEDDLFMIQDEVDCLIEELEYVEEENLKLNQRIRKFNTIYKWFDCTIPE